MDIVFQQLSVSLPVEDGAVIGLEQLHMTAVIGEHAWVRARFLMEEGTVPAVIRRIDEEGRLDIVYRERRIFCGRLLTVRMERDAAVDYLVVEAASYTIDWDFKRRSRSFSIESMTYEEVLFEVLSSYPQAWALDHLTNDQVIPGFLLQYEETDWTFIKRLATHFATWIVPEITAAYGRCFFGIPEKKREAFLEQGSYSFVRDLDTYFKLAAPDRFGADESTRWMVETEQQFDLGDTVIFQEEPPDAETTGQVETIVSGVFYQLVNGEIIFAYELARRSGLVVPYRKNPLIHGMSLTGTVMSRRDQFLKIHLDIDEQYQHHPDRHEFVYSIESSRIRSIPTVGSRIHLYIPGSVEQAAFAVHAVRSEIAPKAQQLFLPAPDSKVFSDTNGARIILSPDGVGILAADEITSLQLTKEGNLKLTGQNIQLLADKDIVIRATGETGSGTAAIGAERGFLAAGSSGQAVHLCRVLQLIAHRIDIRATGGGVMLTDLSPYRAEVISTLTASDQAMVDGMNQQAMEALIAGMKEAQAKKRRGLIMMGEAALMTAVIIAFPPSAGLLATKIGCVKVVVMATGITGFGMFGHAAWLEGDHTVQNLMQGDFTPGENPVLNALGGDRELYEKLQIINGVVFQITSAQILSAVVMEYFGPLVALCKSRQQANMIFHIGKNVVRRTIYDLAMDGTVDPAKIIGEMALGYVQGSLGNLLGASMAGLVGGGAAADMLFTTAADVGLDYLYALSIDQEFDLSMSILLNLLANSGAMLVQEPVDAVSGAYYLTGEDLVIDGLAAGLVLTRSYLSVSQKSGSLGRGWQFSYDSRLYRRPDQTVWVDLPSGHQLLFESECQDGQLRFGIKSKGCPWFTLEQRETAVGHCFELTDLRERRIYQFDPAGRLCEERPQGGNLGKKTFHYDQDGRLSVICLGEGCEVTLWWEGQKIAALQDWTGRTVRYEYEQDRLIRVTHVDGGVVTYAYGVTGYLEQVSNQQGLPYLTNQYDADGRIVRQWLDNGESYEMEHDPSEQKVISRYRGAFSLSDVNAAAAGAGCREEVYYYNGDKLVTRIEYQDGSTQAFRYDHHLCCIEEQNRRGIITRFRYDELGRKVAEERADGAGLWWEYDRNGNLAGEQDGSGRILRYQYDPQHNRTAKMLCTACGDQRLAGWAYDQWGRCIRETDGNGAAVTNTYEGLNRYPSQVEDGEHQMVYYGYDRLGRKIWVETGYGRAEYTYNERNYVTAFTDGEGQTRVWSYNQMGRCIAYCPSDCRRTGGGVSRRYEFRYDSMGRELEMITPEQEHHQKVVNGEGLLLKAIHPGDWRTGVKTAAGTSYDYDPDGNQIRIHYPDGGCERRFYDGCGNLIKRVLPTEYQAEADDGAGMTYTYDSQNRLLTRSNPDGELEQEYEYNGAGQIIREWTGTDQTEIRYQYNALGLVSGRWERSGDSAHYRAVSYEYDGSGNQIRERFGRDWVAFGVIPERCRELTYRYDQNNHLIEVQDQEGACIRYQYDCLGQVIREQKRMSETVWQNVSYQYDRAGRRVEKREEIAGNGEINQAVTRFGYDGKGNVVSMVTPNGHQIRRTYDGCDRLTQEHTLDQTAGIDRRLQFGYDPAGNVTRVTWAGAGIAPLVTGYRYDWKNRLVEEVLPGGGIRRYGYDRNDRQVQECFAGQVLVQRTYERWGNAVKVTNGLGELVETLCYDAARRVTEQNRQGVTTQIRYGPGGRRQEVSRGGKRLAGFEYGAAGELIKTYDGEGQATHFETDGWGRITGVQYGDGSQEGYAYHPAGLVSGTTDGNGNQIRYEYNSLSKVREMTDQCGAREQFFYDREGNQIRRIDRNGTCIETSYTVDGKMLLQRAVQADGRREVLSRYDYDSLGRIRQAVSGGRCDTYEYDEDGRLKRKRSRGKVLVSYTYEPDGQVESVTDETGKSSWYGYDRLRRLREIRAGAGGERLVQYAYDRLNRIQAIHYGSGMRTEYEYNEAGEIARLTTRSDGEVYWDYTYEYDRNGNRIQKVGRYRTESGSCRTARIGYEYDQRNRLSGEREGEHVIRYRYDPAGNRLEKLEDGRRTCYTYNEKNQLVLRKEGAQQWQYRYDPQGNLLEQGNDSEQTCYRYDLLNRQCEIELPDGRVQKNHYDGEGLRVGLEEDGRLCRFVFDRGELLTETREEEGVVFRYQRGYGVEGLEAAGQQSFVMKDEVGSSIYLLDENREIQNFYRYDAFGNGLERSERVANRIGYTGQQYDRVSGQYYLRARYYSPSIGRFFQEDSYRGDGLNLYAYCGNNPVRYFDPSGYMGEGNCPGVGFGASFIDGEGRINVTEDMIREAMQDAPLQTQQGGVSLPKVQNYVDRILAGEVDMPAIKVDNGIIVDGNHRYIAGRITGVEPPQWSYSGGRPDRVVSWKDILISPNEW